MELNLQTSDNYTTFLNGPFHPQDPYLPSPKVCGRYDSFTSNAVKRIASVFALDWITTNEFFCSYFDLKKIPHLSQVVLTDDDNTCKIRV